MSSEKTIASLLDDLTYEAQTLLLCEKRVREKREEILNLLLPYRKKDKVK